MNFKFYIFGRPHAFDLYQGNELENVYFQTFDNGGKENAKLAVHRMANGKISYSYLRYNFISSSGRPNSFFGMSVVFDNEYCEDIQKIFDLFEAIYKGIIEKNGILLAELKGNSTAQAKYLVHTFSEAEREVTNIENNIVNNLKKHFANDILPLDQTFSMENAGMIYLNNDKGNAVFADAIRKYSWLFISPEYKEAVESQKTQDDLRAIINQQEIFKQNLKSLQKQLDDLKTTVLRLSETTHISNTLPPIGTGGDGSTKQRTPIKNFYNKNKSVILGIAGVIVLAVLLLVIKPFGGKPADKEATTTNTEQPVKSEDPTEKLISEGNAALQNNNFDKAISKFTKAGKPDLAENAKQKAIQDLNQKAVAAKTPQESITILEETRKYGNDPDRFIAEYQEKINNVAAAEQKRKDDAAKKAEDKKKKKDRKSDDCKIIKGKFDSANPKTEWTASELLKEAKKKLDAGSITAVMDMCQAIIAKQRQCPNFATAEQLRDAKSYIKRGTAFF